MRLNGIEPLLPDLGQVTNRRHATRPQHVSMRPVGEAVERALYLSPHIIGTAGLEPATLRLWPTELRSEVRFLVKR